MTALGFLSFLLLASCNLFGPGKEETEMLDKLVTGSEFARNHQMLSDAGWLMSYGTECRADVLSEPDRWYFRGNDPTYSLILIYSKNCKLEGARLKRRKGTEL
jgi:hypothetical protein